jgi:hypothetical protein
VIATGALIGGIAGVCYGAIRDRLPLGRAARVLALGTTLTLIFLAYQPPAARSALKGVGQGGLALALFSIGFFAFGWMLELLIARFAPRR